MSEENNITLTNDVEVTNDPSFLIVAASIQSLISSGFINSLGGNCVAAAEMLSLMFHQKGVDATVMECQVSIKRKNENGDDQFNFVGFNGMGLGPSSVDTHVIVVIKGVRPILVDVSIWPTLPSDHPFIVEHATIENDGIIGDYDYGDFRVTYTPKKDLRLPNLHQRSIIDRLRAEEIIKAKLSWVAYVAAGALALGFLNTILNAIIVYFRVLGEM